MVKTIKIKRGAKMHILANGAGRNLRSTITNHLNIRIMRKRIYFKHVSADVINQRGRGFAAYVQFTKEALKNAQTTYGIHVATCIGNKLYDTNTMISY